MSTQTATQTPTCSVFPKQQMREAYVVRLGGSCRNCATSGTGRRCACSDEPSACGCGGLNGDFVVRQTKNDACCYEHVFVDEEFTSGNKPCQVEKLRLSFAEHEDNRVSACVTLFFQDSGPVTWHKPRVCQPCSIGTLRRIRTNTKCCFPQTIAVNGTPVPDFVAPQPEWYRGDPDDLNDAPFWPSLDVDLMEDSPEVPVRFANGELQLRTKDVASNGFGVPWGHSRIYSNRLSHSHDFGNGTNWLVHEWPQLVAVKTDPRAITYAHESGEPTGCTLVMLRGTRNALWFDEYSIGEKETEWRSRFGAKHVLKQDRQSQRVQVIAPNGHLWEFHDFTSTRDLQCAPQGNFARHEDPAGNEMHAEYECCKLKEVWRSGDSGDGTYITESFVYDYYTKGANNGRLHTVLLKRSKGERTVASETCPSASACRQAEKQGADSGGKYAETECGKAGEIRRAEYLYYEDEPHGNLGDLKMAATQICHDGKWKNLAIHYYRYLKQPQDTYCQGLLTLAVDPEGFRRLVKASVGHADRPPILGNLDQELAVIAHASLNDLARRFADYETSTGLSKFAQLEAAYDDKRRVRLIKVNGGLHTHRFEYVHRIGFDVAKSSHVRTITGETRMDGSQRLVLLNPIGQMTLVQTYDKSRRIVGLRKATEIPTGKNSAIEFRMYNERGALYRILEPSSINHRLPIRIAAGALPGLLHRNGRVREFRYRSVGARATYLSGEFVRNGFSGKTVHLRSHHYFNHGDNVWVMSHALQLNVGSDARPDNSEFYIYDFRNRAHVTARQIVQVSVWKKIEPKLGLAILRGENAFIENHDDLDIHIERFDQFRNRVETTDVRGAREILQYYADRGSLKRRTILADGRKLVTDYQVDEFGRTTATLGPIHAAITSSPDATLLQLDVSGRPLVVPKLSTINAATAANVRSATWHRYSDLVGEVRTAQGFTDDKDENAEVMGTVKISKLDRAGRVSDSISARSKQSSPRAVLAGPFVQADWVAWQQVTHDARGLHGPHSRYSVTRTYHLIPRLAGYAGREGLHYHQSVASINTQTRQAIAVSPGGTITQQTHDKFGQLLSTEVGTSKQNMTVVSELVYDEFEHKVNPDRDPRQGSKGLLTKVTQYDGKERRTATIGYDWQDRPSKVFGSQGEVDVEYTLSGNVRSTAKSNQKNGVVNRRVLHTDNRGQIYRIVEHGVYPSSESSNKRGKLTGRTLEHWFKYNGAGDLVEYSPPGKSSPITFVYDQLGRRTEVTVRSSRSVSTKYDDGGNPVLVTDRQYSLDLQGYRTDQVAVWHDPLGRRRYVTDYGVRASGQILEERPRAVPIWRQILGEVQVSTFIPEQYTTKHPGTVASVIDNVGRTTRLLFDHAARLVGRIENLWGTGEPAGLYSNRPFDRNRTTHYSYTAEGDIHEVRLLNAATGEQVTQFLYDNTAESTSDDHQHLKGSDLYASNLLRAIVYPDQSRVDFRYNRQGQVKAMRDQNGTIHVYQHDELGRLIEDRVTRFSPSVTIDKSIDVLSYWYNDRGLMSYTFSSSSENLKALSDTRTARWLRARNPESTYHYVLREASDSMVRRAYDEFDRLTGETQSRLIYHNRFGDPDQTHVDYRHYGGYTNRLGTVVYPSAKKLWPLRRLAGVRHIYAPDTVDSLVGRPTGIDIVTASPLNVETIAEYDYWGIANRYRATYQQPGIKSDLGRRGLKPLKHAAFASLDDFDRLRQLAWCTDAKALVNLAFDYDRSNNVYRQADGIAPATVRDEIYGRDLLDRLTSLRRGKADDFRLTVPPQSKDGASGLQFSQNWTLDYAGNWRVFKQDDDGDGNEELRQLRLHTPSNDIFLLEPTSASLHPVAQGLRKGLFALAGLGTAKGPKWHHPQYDAAGNLIQIPQPNKPEDGYRCIYDAWNRLAVVGLPQKNGSIRRVARFSYDGLGRVITKLTYNKLDHVAEERHFIYSGDQLIQEQVYHTGDKRFGKFRVDRQYVWGPQGPNDLILRLRDKEAKGIMNERRYALQDAQGNVVALTDEKGEVQERFRYRPRGEVEFYDAAYNPKEKSECEWEMLAGTQRRDATTGLIIGSGGAYHPLLGRSLQSDILLMADEEIFRAYYQHALATADPGSFRTLRRYRPPTARPAGAPERTLGDRAGSVALTGGLAVANYAAWANPFWFITGPIVTGGTLIYGIYTSYQARHEHFAHNGDLAPWLTAGAVFTDVTGFGPMVSAALGEDVITGQPLSTADRLEYAAHVAIGIVAFRATTGLTRPTGPRLRMQKTVARKGPKRIYTLTEDFEKIVSSGRVWGQTEGSVYGLTNRQWWRGWVDRPKRDPGVVVFVDDAARLFHPHPFEGPFSLAKRLFGQQRAGFGDLELDMSSASRRGNVLVVRNATLGVHVGQTRQWALWRLRGRRFVVEPAASLALLGVGYKTYQAFFGDNE